MAVGNGNRKEQFEQLDGVIAQWKGVEGGLLPIMQHAQEILGCVDEEVQHYISAATGIPVSTIYGVATFYSTLFAVLVVFVVFSSSAYVIILKLQITKAKTPHNILRMFSPLYF